MELPDIDFSRIRPAPGQGRREGFEQFVCELAALDPPSPDSEFVRLEGAGGDGGVECFWTAPDGSEDGWQAKYWTAPGDVNKAQLDHSVRTALQLHPRLTRYTIAIPVDPTGPTGGQGRSLLEKIEGNETTAGWRAGWQQMAAENGMDVEFRVVWRTHLVTRLHETDPHGVRTRYWFDEDLLSEAWWQDRLNTAVQAARPRYVPAVAVPVAASTAIAGLCGDPEWAHAIENELNATADVLKKLRRAEAEMLAGDIDAVGTTVQAVMDGLRQRLRTPGASHPGNLHDSLQTARETAVDQERREVEALDERHGDWDSVGWRQFQAEYQVSFPAAGVDALRSMLTRLDEFEAFLNGAVERFAGAQTALLTGAAGTGKTFVTLDTVARRLDEGRPSVFVHGRWFRDDDPLVQLRDKLQLPTDLNGDQALGVLDQAGRVAGAPVLLVLDALNETVPRRMWRQQLDLLIAALDKYPNVRVLLTVRTHYRGQVIPESVELPAFDHRGFEGVEFEAVTEYADYYELEPPAAPPLHPELDNPLFLRLLCEALTAAGYTSLEQAGMSLSEIVKLLLDEKNRLISSQLDAPERDRLVHRAMQAMVTAFRGSPSSSLPRHEARTRLEGIWGDQTAEGSLLEALIAEGLLGEDVVPEAGSSDTDVVVVAFEWLGQYLYVNGLMEDVGSVGELQASLTDSPLHQALWTDGGLDRGLLEALSVAVAEQFGVELTEFDEVADAGDAVTEAVVAGLAWRTPASVTNTTKEAVRAALTSPVTAYDAMNMVLRLAPKPDHPLNADWLYQSFLTPSMAERDAFLVPWLHETHDSGGAVDRLTRWAREQNLRALSPDTCRLWVSALLWCASSSDRRVRDMATVAAARLLARQADQCAPVLDRFLRVNDDWVVERAIDVAYTALLRTSDRSAWAAAAEVIWASLFRDHVPDNAVIRDEGRAVLEAAAMRNALPDGVQPRQFRPPYESDWPIEWPEPDDIAAYDDLTLYPKLVWSCTEDDFFRYQVSRFVRDREGINPPAVGRRIVLDVIGLGYDPARHASFDRYVIATFGGGRGKPAWMERIGKKYQWIALARLAGPIADHTPPTQKPSAPPPTAIPPPQAEQLRHLDPTVCEPTDHEEAPRAWVPSYHRATQEGGSVEQWVADDDIPEIALTDAAAQGEPHLVLSGHYEWAPVWAPDASWKPQIWISVTSLLVNDPDLASVLEQLDGRDLAGASFVRPSTLPTGYIGEYPFGIHYTAELHRFEHERTHGPEARVEPGSFHLLGEYEYAPHELDTVSIDAPSPLLFGASPGTLTWDGASSWRDEHSNVVARIRSPNGDNNELTVNRTWMQDWLAHHQMTLVWVEIGGKHVLTGGFDYSPGRLLRTRTRYWSGGALEQLDPVYHQLPPQQD